MKTILFGFCLLIFSSGGSQSMKKKPFGWIALSVAIFLFSGMAASPACSAQQQYTVREDCFVAETEGVCRKWVQMLRLATTRDPVHIEFKRRQEMIHLEINKLEGELIQCRESGDPELIERTRRRIALLKTMLEGLEKEMFQHYSPIVEDAISFFKKDFQSLREIKKGTVVLVVRKTDDGLAEIRLKGIPGTWWMPIKHLALR